MIDILTILGSSYECERLFSELSDLLEPKRHAINSKLLTIFQLIRAWTQAGYNYCNGGNDDGSDGYNNINDKDLTREYGIYN